MRDAETDLPADVDASLRILLVEDNEDDAFLFSEMLETAAVRADLSTVHRLSAAEDLLDEKGFDVVFLDLGLPESVGLETFLRFHEHSSRLPVVVLTGLEDDAVALQALKHGAQDFLVKGHVTPAMLVRTIRFSVERKRSEKQRRLFEAGLQRAQKLESLGVLAGGIAHDFNNILQGILGHAELALLNTADTSPCYASIKAIAGEARRGAELTRQMLDYSGKGVFMVRPLDLNRLIVDMASLIAASIPREGRIEFELAEALPEIDGDANQLQQILMSLVANAADALGESGGVITVATGQRQCDPEYLQTDYTTDRPAAGPYAYIDVIDTGSGMTEETRAAMFDPFYSTKFTGRGLGLAAVLGIVRGHNGVIKVRTAPGKGATVRVLFPIPTHTRTGETRNG